MAVGTDPTYWTVTRPLWMRIDPSFPGLHLLLNLLPAPTSSVLPTAHTTYNVLHPLHPAHTLLAFLRQPFKY